MYEVQGQLLNSTVFHSKQVAKLTKLVKEQDGVG